MFAGLLLLSHGQVVSIFNSNIAGSKGKWTHYFNKENSIVSTKLTRFIQMAADREFLTELFASRSLLGRDRLPKEAAMFLPMMSDKDLEALLQI